VKRKHHELVAWQVAVALVKDIYQLTESFPSHEIYGLTAQIRRAAVSVPSNLAEGAARATKKEFAHYLVIARASLSEIDTQLAIAKHLGYIGRDEDVQATLDRVFGLIGGLLNSLQPASQ
jgi:four helix bundle protein